MPVLDIAKSESLLILNEATIISRHPQSDAVPAINFKGIFIILLPKASIGWELVQERTTATASKG